MTIESEPHPSTGQPVGLQVDQTPAQPPGPVTLEGRYGRVEKLAPRHEADLWKTVQGHDQTWTYMSTYGPFADAANFSRWFAGRLKLDDPYSYALVDRSGQAVGIATLMEIRPAMRVIEVGHIVYSPAVQRTPLGHRGAVSAGALRLRDARLPALRMEMQCAQRTFAAGGATLWFRLRGRPAPAVDRQGQESRHRLLLDARQRMARAQGRLRALARAGEFRRGGQAEGEPERIERRRIVGWAKARDENSPLSAAIGAAPCPRVEGRRGRTVDAWARRCSICRARGENEAAPLPTLRSLRH